MLKTTGISIKAQKRTGDAPTRKKGFKEIKSNRQRRYFEVEKEFASETAENEIANELQENRKKAIERILKAKESAKGNDGEN
jgi:hypothetical protein